MAPNVRPSANTAPLPAPRDHDRVAVALAKIIDAVNMRRHGAQDGNPGKAAA